MELITLIAVWVALTLFIGIHVSEWVNIKFIDYYIRKQQSQQSERKELYHE